MTRETKCRNCAGKGEKPSPNGIGWRRCTVCYGTGKVSALTRASRRG